MRNYLEEKPGSLPFVLDRRRIPIVLIPMDAVYGTGSVYDDSLSDVDRKIYHWGAHDPRADCEGGDYSAGVD